MVDNIEVQQRFLPSDIKVHDYVPGMDCGGKVIKIEGNKVSVEVFPGDFCPGCLFDDCPHSQNGID